MGDKIALNASDGHTLDAYIAGARDAGQGLVVIQEIFGVNRHIRAVSDRLAAAGYAVCAPALYDRVAKDVELGYTRADISKGRQYRMKLTDAQIMADVEAAAKHLTGKNLGIVGYCFGGTVAWWGATRSHAFKATCCWYGGGIAATKDERPNCPVQMHFGDRDRSIPMRDIDAIRTAQPLAEIYIYRNAGHGFGCGERASYNQAASELAQQRSLEFLAKHLG